MEYPKYEFYVINYNFNEQDIEMWNIFNNWKVAEEVFDVCKKHLRNKNKLTFDELQKEIDEIIMWQEWSRVEYEISAGYPFPESLDELRKVDCYWQAKPNMKLITEMCIERTKEFLKEKKDENITKHHIET